MAIVYEHRRKDNNNVFYIGIGKEEKRAFETIKNRRNQHWHRVINKHGYTVNITHKDICWEDACKIEEYLIAFYREYLGKDNVANITDGGEGSNGLIMSDESKEKMRIKKLGTKQSEQVRKKIGEAISKALQNPEIIAKYSAASKGRKHSQEVRNKISIARKGGGNGSARKVKNIITGEIFECMKYAAESIGMPCGTLQHQLSGYCKNKTHFIYA